MTKEEITKIVCEMISNDAGVSVDAVTPQTSLEDLGIDSLDMLEIVIDLEYKFFEDEVIILDEAVSHWRTVEDIINYVEKELANSSAA